ncbi:MAG: AzlD domain-containing protein [Methyloligellaceae bacterium]
MNEALTIWLAVVLGSLVTFGFRASGAFLSASLQPQSPVFLWISCVSYGLLAALVSRMIFLPIGELETIPLILRLAALGSAAIAYLVFKRSVIAAVSFGVLALIGLASWVPI